MLEDTPAIPNVVESHGIDALLPTVYEELRGLAEAVLQRRRPVDAPRTTSLINDVYLRLASHDVRFQDRTHFLCIASRAMRQVLVDRARRAFAAKRGGGQTAHSVTADEAIAPAIDESQLLAIHEALARLATFDERKAQITELRFFGGLSLEETAEVIGVSPATVKREWTMARAWFFRELGNADQCST